MIIINNHYFHYYHYYYYYFYDDDDDDFYCYWYHHYHFHHHHHHHFYEHYLPCFRRCSCVVKPGKRKTRKNHLSPRKVKWRAENRWPAQLPRPLHIQCQNLCLWLLEILHQLCEEVLFIYWYPIHMLYVVTPLWLWLKNITSTLWSSTVYIVLISHTHFICKITPYGFDC